MLVGVERRVDSTVEGRDSTSSRTATNNCNRSLMQMCSEQGKLTFNCELMQGIHTCFVLKSLIYFSVDLKAKLLSI